MICIFYFRKAILKNLPNQATLANTPYTPASTMKKLDINGEIDIQDHQQKWTFFLLSFVNTSTNNTNTEKRWVVCAWQRSIQYIMLLSMFSPYKQHQILCNEANTSVNWWFFYCTELKKAGTLNTPSIAFSNKNKLAFSATPCQNKNARKRLGLFSPASSRKGRKYVWTHKFFIFFFNYVLFTCIWVFWFIIMTNIH